MSKRQTKTATVEGRYGRLEAYVSGHPVGDALVMYGEWAQAELDVLRAFIGLGSTVVEVGADIGAHTLALAQVVGADGQIVAVEPRPAALRLLERNLTNSGLSNVMLQSAAIQNSATGQIAPIEGLRSCHLIKIALQGQAAETLAGLAGLLIAHRPVVWVRCDRVADGQAVFDGPGWERYVFFLVATACYNPDNYASNAENAFGAARDLHLLCIPQELEVLTPASSQLTSVTPLAGREAFDAAFFARAGAPSDQAPRLPARTNDGGVGELLAAVAALREALASRSALQPLVGDEPGRYVLDLEAARVAVRRAEFRAKSLTRQLEQAEQGAAAAISALNEQLAAARDELIAALRDMADRERRIFALEAELAALRNSTSWRLTRPVRWLRGART